MKVVRLGYIRGRSKKFAPTATKKVSFLWLLVQIFFNTPLLHEYPMTIPTGL